MPMSPPAMPMSPPAMPMSPPAMPMSPPAISTEALAGGAAEVVVGGAGGIPGPGEAVRSGELGTDVEPVPASQREPVSAGGRATDPDLLPPPLRTSRDLHVPEAPRSEPPPSSAPSSSFPPPPPSSRIVASDPAEVMLVDRLHRGDPFAGDELIELWGPEALARRAHDVLAVRKRQLALAPHRLALIKAAHEAAVADGSPAYARALEHVLAVAGCGGRDGASAEPVPAPPAYGHVLEPELAHALLFRELATPVLDLLACVWETGIARKDPGAYGLTGAERVSLGAPTPLARLVASLAPLFGQARPVYFLPGPEPPRVRPALLAHPSILVTGNPHDDDPHLSFQLGATWAATMPEHAIALGAPEFAARNLLDAVLAAFGPVGRALEGGQSAEVARLGAELYQRVLPRTERRLRALCEAEADLGYDVARDVARLAARRAGLLACGDLATALGFVAADLGLDLAHAATPEGFEHAVASSPEVADLVRLATRMEYAEARWS
jgi:hypothetical protein